MKILKASSGIDPATLWLLAKFFKRLSYNVPYIIMYHFVSYAFRVGTIIDTGQGILSGCFVAILSADSLQGCFQRNELLRRRKC
jgi:hypothetical protein